ncbi:MAG TPA: sulfite reductase flavoprotein subunit alpha [Pseudomonas sp.]|uniref:sulfite reductase flavoprotein subunit alpha n=1 Tax=Pseudomonas sp. TaxID=306 RepID=UPI002B73477B|nr:sulfite reductase flavoprotein subunit alpha [Pseudomonas sp.]HTO18967.1 sulfite reductase flavoprotein subunit alpha [Pseudomonas sp.]
MLKKILFQLHWLFGISAGLVLAVMGVTGALYSFEGEILRLLNSGHGQLATAGAQRLELGELVARLESSSGERVVDLRIDDRHAGPATAYLAPPPGERRGARILFDPANGHVLGAPRGQEFFQVVLQLHRWLAMGETGKQITAASTLILIFLCLSGLYLRWPRRAGHWRTWLSVDWRKTGRGFHWDLHAVAGTWVLPFYLCASLTGLYWSYDWYRAGLTALLADPPPAVQARQPAADAPATPDYAALWQGMQRAAGPQLIAWNLRLPAAAGQPATIFYILRGAEHVRAFNLLQLDPRSGEIVRHERYADKTLKARLLTSVYALHSGEYFGLPGKVLMLLASALMPLFLVTGWLLYLDRRRKRRAARAARSEPNAAPGNGWLIGYASQSGFAEQLAWQSAGQLQAAGLAVRVEPLARLDAASLRRQPRALFVLSTFGDGEAPDDARGFERRLLGATLPLDRLAYAVLALGDRRYEQFCAFARRVDAWLERQGGKRLFESIEVDDQDSTALRHWQRQLSELTGTAVPAWHGNRWTGWTLQRRQLLNPGSQGGPVFQLTLTPETPSDWRAGDILEIRPRHSQARVVAWLQRHGRDADEAVELDGQRVRLAEALSTRQLPETFAHRVGLHGQALVDSLMPLASREYSIASIPADGVLELFVRQVRHAGGDLGLCSGWLTVHLAEGDQLLGRIRRNSAFHLPADDRPLILIGNGTGLSGLRALLRARTLAGQRRNWLLFGERQRAHDFYCAAELQAALERGDLRHLDLAFSRDQPDKLYVQDLLRRQQDRLRDWLAEGAALYVCGSLDSMAAGVDATLHELLGAEAVRALVEAGRYRRDVY